MRKGLILFLFALLLGPLFSNAEIKQPYVVDEKPRTTFADSVDLGNYFGLENYQAEYVEGYLHITYTQTHHPCCFAGFPPSVYITDVDPRTTSAPAVRLMNVHSLIGQPLGWYLIDIQFDATGYAVTLKESGVTEVSYHRIGVPDMQNTDWAALANTYPIYEIGGEPSMHSMSFTPMPIKSGEGCSVNCYSNVLFLPGLKGSILNNGSDTIWPPTIFSNDVPQLALNYDGTSVNNIKVAGILERAGPTQVYGPFADYMSSLAGDLIKEWAPLAYDWRFSPDEILEDGIQTEDGVVNALDKLETLASNSRTGKVTIIAHSMGGLLGKAIIKELESQGKDDLIDSFIMVGSPQLGTPQAVGSMLHGDDEGVLGGLVVDRSDIREISLNMPSAYHLLPSKKYFNEVSDPIITFDANASFTDTWRNFYGSLIDNYTELVSFLIDEHSTRTKPPKTTMPRPEILRADLVSEAGDFHEVYDNYELPEHIRVVQVAGWGVPTVKGIHYTTHHFFQSYEVLPTLEGDKTVVYPSAISSNVDKTYYFNLYNYRRNIDSEAQHKDLLSAEPMQVLLESIISKDTFAGNTYISSIKPQVTNTDDQLRVASNSPVILGAFDSFNNFTGVDQNQNLANDILTISEKIPGSTFLYSGESQSIFLPKEGEYKFVYRGIGDGPTTIEIELFSGDQLLPIATYLDMPTTPDTEASFQVSSDSPEDTVIAVDVNGDGEEDINLEPTPENILTPYSFSGFLQPINDITYHSELERSVFKAGGTVPVKFQMKNSDGAVVQTQSAPIWVAPKIISSMNAAVDEAMYTLPASSGNEFRWDTINQQYIYNWSTKGFKGGKWYRIGVKLDDGTTRFVVVGLR